MMKDWVIMGVCGCGKTTIGSDLAKALGLSFIDADDLHPPFSVEKMAAGLPLGDMDREPWLRAVGRAIAQRPEPVVVGCSALRRKYRDIIRLEADRPVGFVHLHGTKDLIVQRVSERTGHFMPADLVDSQFRALEPLGGDEDALTVSVKSDPENIVRQILHEMVKEKA